MYPGGSYYGDKPNNRDGGYGYGYGYGSATAELFTARRLLKVVRRHWLLILLMILVGTGASMLYFWKADRVYRSVALIEMSVRGARITDDVITQDFGRSEEVFNTRLGRLRGNAFEIEAVKLFEENWNLFGRPLPGDEIPEFGKISYDMIRLSRLVEISAEANDPMVAAVSAQSAAEAAQAFFEDENEALSEAAVKWLQEQSRTQKANLAEAEQNLLAFRSESRLDTLKAQQDADRQSLLTLNELLINYENELLRAREFLKAVQEVTVDLTTGGVEIPGSLPNRAMILELVQQYQAAQAAKAQMLEVKTERHPDVVQLNLQIQEYAESIRREFRLSKASFEQEIEVFEGQKAAVQKRIEELTEEVSQQELELVEKESRLNELLRERNAAELALNNVLTRIEQARLAADEDTATLKIVDAAKPEEEPVHPKLIIVIPLGVMGGLMLGGMLALTLETMEDRIFSIAELEAEISSRIIGIIPHIAGGKRADLAMISLNQKFGQVAEAFNAVRVILDHVNNNRIRETREKGLAHPGGHVVMFCSASPGEGKTVSATNVAITSARAGQKTLLIDCDMRRPRLAKVFEDGMEAIEGDDPNRYSLLHHLATVGGKDFESIILPGPTEHLDLMASLASSDVNPSDLLGGENIKHLVTWARKNYDRVIIDTPPIGLISDGLVISNLSDGVVAICRAAQTRHRAIRHVLLQFKGVGANVIGIIVNDFNMKKAAEPLDVHYRDFAAGYAKSGYQQGE
jgi:capsular exopolysaccharide synthesis family protein